MAKDINKVSLGAGELYINNVDVGYLKGDVELTYAREKVPFKPATELAPVKKFVVGDDVRIKASIAEIKPANIRLALGVSTAVGSSQSFPDYDPSSFSPTSGDSFDVLHFGGLETVSEFSVRFEHTKSGTTKQIIVVLYNATTETDLLVPFHETEIILHDLVFQGLAVEGRSKGDKIGFIAECVEQS